MVRMEYNQTRLNLHKKIRRELEQRKNAAHGVRVGIGDKIVNVTPNFQNDNIRPGTLAGLMYAATAAIVERYSPVPITADTEIAEVQATDDGMLYTVNVDAPLEQQARFQAMAESGQGFISFFTDEMVVQDSSVPKKRVTRDTWQFEVLVADDKDVEGEKEKLGLGILQGLAE